MPRQLVQPKRPFVLVLERVEHGAHAREAHVPIERERRVRLLRVPYRLMFPCIVIFCAIGIYSVNNAPVDVILAGVFGLVGYWLIKHDFEPAPLLLGMVLGPLMEENLRRALLISRGDWSVFLTRPLSAVLLAIAFAPEAEKHRGSRRSH